MAANSKTAVTEVAPGHVALADGTTIPTHCVVWGGGIKAAGLAGTSGLTPGRGGRIDVLGDLGVQWAREQGRDRFLTLAGASVLIPPGRREEIGTIRIDIAHVAAWWPARFEATEAGAGQAQAQAAEGGGEEGLAG